MATRKTTPKVRPQSAGETLEDAIRSALDKVPVPNNPFCDPTIAEVTLDNIHDLMAFLGRVDLEAWVDSDQNYARVLRELRAMATQAIRYAQVLVALEDEMRGAARRQAYDLTAENAQVGAHV